MQLARSNSKRVHGDLLKWREKSAASGHRWAISMDEIGPAKRGAVPDQDDPMHNEMRGPVLWGSLLGGAAGVEWYFGYEFAHNDLGAEDWRSRDGLWKQTRIASKCFEKHLPFWRMQPADQAVSGCNAYCLAEPGQVYAIYQQAGQRDAKPMLDLSDHSGRFSVRWLNPRQGGSLQTGSRSSIQGGKIQTIGAPPEQPDQDWVAIVKRDD